MYRRHRNANLLGQFIIFWSAGGPQDINTILSQLRMSIARAFGVAMAMIVSVLDIFANGCPFKVIPPWVPPIAIFMVNQMLWRRLWGQE